ncbi:hypothetical protein LJK88_27225 [Paenibacillus sp. P26]|nr:hypothetical protein LJK88_27225 [Paenibacillus sp. P26]
MAIGWEKEMFELVGETGLLLDNESKTRLSKDYYWYSPVLDRRSRKSWRTGSCCRRKNARYPLSSPWRTGTGSR